MTYNKADKQKRENIKHNFDAEHLLRFMQKHLEGQQIENEARDLTSAATPSNYQRIGVEYRGYIVKIITTNANSVM